MINYTDIKKEDFQNIECIKMTDSESDSGLEVYSYTECTDEHPEIVKRCRGVIFQGDNLVVKTFDYTPEYNENDISQISNHLTDISNVKFYLSLEGTMIRVFNINDTWYVSTQKKLDAYKSRWGSQYSFGQLFEQAISEEWERNSTFREKYETQNETQVIRNFLDGLNKDNVYIFFIKNTDSNRLVCRSNETSHKIYHIGTYTNKCTNFNLDDDIGLSYPHQLQFNSTEEVINYVRDLNPLEQQGVMVFLPDGCQIKIVNSQYQKLVSLRGNDPSISRRYIVLRNTPERVEFVKLYSDYETTFNKIEMSIFTLAKYIYKSYVKRFINKEFAQVTPSEYQIIKECHGWHLEDRENHKIHFDKVNAIVNKHNPVNLFRILNTTYGI